MTKKMKTSITNIEKSLKRLYRFIVYKLLKELNLEWTLKPQFKTAYIGHGRSEERYKLDSFELTAI
jgi:hypothetical protein